MVDCRRILKWTYTYGYYTFGEHADRGSASKLSPPQLKQSQEFFEFNQVLPAGWAGRAWLLHAACHCRAGGPARQGTVVD